MFIRTKKVGKHRYAYLVENIWTKNGTRQKNAAYLGRITEHQTEPISLTTFTNPFSEIISQAFSKEKQTKNKIITDTFTVSKIGGTLTAKKPIVLQSHEGYCCTYTLRQIKHCIDSFQSKDDAPQLAEAIIGAGLLISPESFIALFKHLTKNF